MDVKCIHMLCTNILTVYLSEQVNQPTMDEADQDICAVNDHDASVSS